MRISHCDLHEKDYPTGQGCYECLFEDYHATTVMMDNLKGELRVWKDSYAAAEADAKQWRRDAQELQGVLNDIRAELQSRAIHLLSKHCWCEPTGHPWTQKGTVAE